MKLRTIATPLTIASFVGVAVTGICLLVGIRGGLVAPVHEISSIFFVIGSSLHIVVNGKDTNATVSAIASANGREALAVLSLLLPAKQDAEERD